MEATGDVLKEKSSNIPDFLDQMDTDESNIQKKKTRVAYIFNDQYLRLCDQLPKVKGRATITHSLITAYGLLPKMKLVNAAPADERDIQLFHSEEYVSCLRRLSQEEEDLEKCEEDADMYGLTYDCPAYPGVFDYASYVAGASVKAAQCLLNGYADIAINWPGGWHHAKRDEACGFCYLNDIVIATLKLRQKYERVLYVDLDLHHGDGVEDAFCATSKVMTVSFHKTSAGFFPGTGKLSDIGVGKGRYYNVNVPLKDGIQTDKYVQIFNKVLDLVCDHYSPQAVVCQCGADGLAGDPMASYNLTPTALVQCVKKLQSLNVPLLLLGGGGYDLANTARCWTAITGAVLGEELPSEIPEHKFFTLYGPDYDLDIHPGNRCDTNDDAYIEEVLGTIQENLHQVYQ